MIISGNPWINIYTGLLDECWIFMSDFCLFVVEIACECLVEGLFPEAWRHADMMPVSCIADIAQFLLQARDMRRAAAAEETVAKWLACELAFARIEFDFAILGGRRRESEIHWADKSHIAAVATATAQCLREHGMVNNLAFGIHEALWN